MKEHNDILLTDDFDLMHSGGDLVTGDCLVQQQALLLTAGEGEIKQSPTTGVGMYTFLNDEDEQALFAKIRSQFRLDGLTVTRLTKAAKIEITSSHA